MANDLGFVIKHENQFVDVGRRKIVIWGGGEEARYISYFYQLREIEYVVDRNKHIEGTVTVLFGKEYRIQNTDILNCLDENDFFILIGSTTYRESIKENINKKYGNRFFICENYRELFRKYSDISLMIISDPILVKKIGNNNTSFLIEDYVNETVCALAAIGIENHYFIPIYEGIRISFIVITEKNKFVVHFPARIYREVCSPSENRFIQQIYNHADIINDVCPIILYYGITGICIEKYADNVLWDNNSLLESIELIKRLHNSGKKVGYCRDPWQRAIQRETFIQKRGMSISAELKEFVSKAIKPRIVQYEKKICHGDFHIGNVVRYHQKLVMIDWEWVGMSNPTYDLCHFYNSLRIDADIDKIYEMYLGREPNREELEHIRSMKFFDLYISFLFDSIIKNKVDKQREEYLISNIDSVRG